MPAIPDVLGTLKQARSHAMAKAKLIEIIVAREGTANREATTAAVEKVIEFQIAKRRIAVELRNGAEHLVLVE